MRDLFYRRQKLVPSYFNMLSRDLICLKHFLRDCRTALHIALFVRWYRIRWSLGKNVPIEVSRKVLSAVCSSNWGSPPIDTRRRH
jgi:hypothetical protein